jgi:hypothetical protein
MAIRIRRGNQVDFDPNKLVPGELGLVLDAGKLYFCYSAGNTKQLTTAEDVQTLLNASPDAYTALQQCITDLNNNPSELTNILNNISTLRSSKIDKTSISDDLVTDDANKVLSAKQGKALNDNLVNLYTALTIPGLTGKKIEVVAGTIRQDPTDRAKWNYIVSAGHKPVGISGTYATASGPTITINFGKTYTNILSFVAGPDETLANVYQASVGASVGLNTAVLQMSGRIDGEAVVRYDGTSWVYTNTTGASLVTGVSNTGANVSIDHAFCPGKSLNVVPFSNAGAVIPYMPVIKAIADNNFVVNFVNTTTGAFVSTIDTKMCMRFNKEYNDGFILDGTGGYSAVPLENGNIWFIGIFEV